MLALLCVYTLRTLHSRVKSGFFNSLDVILSRVVHLDICTCLILCQLFDFRKSSSPTVSQLSCLFRFMICGQSGPCPLGTSFKCVAGASGDFLPVPLESWTSHFSRILFSSPFWRLPLSSGSQRGSWGQRSHCGHKRRVFVAPHSEHQSPESCLVIVEGDSPPCSSGPARSQACCSLFTIGYSSLRHGGALLLTPTLLQSSNTHSRLKSEF